jgi:molecular chaperone DnaK
MRKDAEEHADEDKQLREKVEIKNQADSAVFQAEKMLKEYKDKISDDSRSKVQGAIDRVKETLKGDDTDAMKSATETLNEAWHSVSSEMYAKAKQSAGGGPGAQPGAGGPSPEEESSGQPKEKKSGKEGDVIDADFEMVDEDKKK